jgi:hypothetical protein
VQELGGGDHEDVRHSSRQDPKNLENEVIPLFPRGREEDSQEGDENGMPLMVGDVIELVVCWWGM